MQHHQHTGNMNNSSSPNSDSAPAIHNGLGLQLDLTDPELLMAASSITSSRTGSPNDQYNQMVVGNLKEEIIQYRQSIMAMKHQYDSLYEQYRLLANDYHLMQQSLEHKTREAEQLSSKVTVMVEQLPKRKELVYHNNNMQKKQRPYDSLTSTFQFK
jgi:hypothetical protein